MYNDTDYLMHHGILGQRWGVRRFQNMDGSLKNLGQFKRDMHNRYIDTMDTLNRKGVLNFLDSKADSPFTAVRSGKTAYKSEASKDPFRVMENLDRYLNMNDSTRSREKWRDRATQTAMDSKDRASDQKAFSTALDYFQRNKDNYTKWSDGLRARQGQSVFDKKLGMISKDARDIERVAKGKELVDKLSNTKWDVGQLSSRWYKTDSQGRLPQFKGKQWVTEMQDVVTPKYKEVVTPEHIKTSHIRYFKMPGDTRPGLTGTQTGEFDNTKTLYKWNEHGYVDLPIKTRIPEDRKIVRDGWKVEKQKVVVGSTKEYRSFMDGLEMSRSFDHLADTSKPTMTTGSKWVDDFLQHSYSTSDVLVHHGIRGQKWGARRYQNSDGSLTPLGRVRYGVGSARKSFGDKITQAKNTAKGAASKALDKAKETANIDSRLERAGEAYNKHQKKVAIRELRGKKKKLKDMSDEEVAQRLRRLEMEMKIKEIESNNKKSGARKVVEQALANGVQRGVTGLVDNALTNIGRNVFDPNKNQSEFNENKARLQNTVLTGNAEESAAAARRLSLLSSTQGGKGKDKKNEDKKYTQGPQVDVNNNKKKTVRENSRRNQSKSEASYEVPKSDTSSSSRSERTSSSGSSNSSNPFSRSQASSYRRQAESAAVWVASVSQPISRALTAPSSSSGEDFVRKALPPAK